jgi:hypothetical protein
MFADDNVNAAFSNCLMQSRSSREVRIITGAYIRLLGEVKPYSSTVPLFYTQPFTKMELHQVNNSVYGNCAAEPKDATCLIYGFDIRNSETTEQLLRSMKRDMGFSSAHTFSAPLDPQQSDWQNQLPVSQHLQNLDLGFSTPSNTNGSTRRRRLIDDILGEGLSYCCGVVSKRDLQN